MVTDLSRLTESPGVMLKHPHSGADYYTGEQIITHLNYALGPDGWDWTPLDRGLDAEADEVWVLGQLTARFLVDAPDHDGYEMRTTVKIECGWQPINKKRDGSRISLGNDYKAAATDALKRCARLLGVGLDAWAKDEPASARPAARPSTPPQEQAPPKPLKTKAELVADLNRGIASARALGLTVEDVNAEALNRDQLIERIKDLAQKIRDAQAKQPTAASA